MKVLVIGSGGREHALAWKIRQSPRVSEVLVAPGNAGTAVEPGVRNVAVAMHDIDGLLALAKAENVALTVVGPEVRGSHTAPGLTMQAAAAAMTSIGRSSSAWQPLPSVAEAWMVRRPEPV